MSTKKKRIVPQNKSTKKGGETKPQKASKTQTYSLKNPPPVVNGEEAILIVCQEGTCLHAVELISQLLCPEAQEPSDEDEYKDVDVKVLIKRMKALERRMKFRAQRMRNKHVTIAGFSRARDYLHKVEDDRRTFSRIFYFRKPDHFQLIDRQDYRKIFHLA